MENVEGNQCIILGTKKAGFAFIFEDISWVRAILNTKLKCGTIL